MLKPNNNMKIDKRLKCYMIARNILLGIFCVFAALAFFLTLFNLLRFLFLNGSDKDIFKYYILGFPSAIIGMIIMISSGILRAKDISESKMYFLNSFPAWVTYSFLLIPLAGIIMAWFDRLFAIMTLALWFNFASVLAMISEMRSTDCRLLKILDYINSN